MSDNPAGTGDSGAVGQMRVLMIPLIGGKVVVVEGRFPLTEAAWAHFMAVLEVMRPGLVADPLADVTAMAASPNRPPADSAS